MTECGENRLNVKSFLFFSFERTMVLLFCLISFILNIIIIISICLAKNKKISIVVRITGSILLVNFFNIFSYSLEWVSCHKKDGNGYSIRLLVEKADTFYICKIQSFILISSALSQDYLVILFFFVVNNKKMLKLQHINIFIFLSVIFPFIISMTFELLKALGVNDDFCYIKKYKHIKNTEFESYENYNIFFYLIYSLRVINLIISIFLLIKITKYIINEKSLSYIINKLSMLLIQLFKLIIILSYRILTYFLDDIPASLKKIYIILSTLDGLLLPLAFTYSNEIFYNFCEQGKNSRRLTIDDNEEENNPNNQILPKDDEIKKCVTKSISMYNSNNFDLSYE